MRPALRSFALLSLLHLFVVGAAAQSTDSPNTKQAQSDPPGQYGAITGFVISEDGPVPFANITVSPVSTRARGNSSRNVTADIEGKFKVDGLRPIAWRVRATAPGYVPVTDEFSNQNYYRTSDHAMIRMSRGGVITGRVLNTVGEPLVSVRVSAQMVRDALGNAGPGAGFGGDFQTDDRGIYRIYGLPAGTYVVVASSSSNSPGFGPGSRLSPYEGDVPVYHPSSTRDAAAEVTVNSGVETSGIDIQYRSDKGHVVSGTVSGAASNNAAPGGFVSIMLTHAATGTVYNRAFVTQRGRGAVSNNGFAIYGVPDGEYEVTGYRNSPDGDDASSSPRRVVVSGKDVTGIELILKPLASISGRMLLEAGNRCESNRSQTSFEEQVFTLRSEDPGEQRGVRSLFRSSVPDRAGELMFRELVAGRYRIVPQVLDERWFIHSITIPGAAPRSSTRIPARTPVKPSSVDVGRNGFSMRSGDRVTGVTITAAEGAAAIKGKVTAAEGAILPSELMIHLIPVEREKADDVLRYAETRAMGGKEFNLTNLAPGKYWILARSAARVNEKPKAWSPEERAKMRKEAEAMNNIIELQSCQRIQNYELLFKNPSAN